MAWTNARALKFREGLDGDDSRFTDVQFSALMQDSLAQVASVYRAADAPLSAAARSELKNGLLEDAREKRSKHNYRAEDFGLSEEMLTRHFDAYYQCFIKKD